MQNATCKMMGRRRSPLFELSIFTKKRGYVWHICALTKCVRAWYIYNIFIKMPTYVYF